MVCDTIIRLLDIALKDIMKQLSKDDILTAIAILILLITAIITFTFYSWLVLVAIIILLIAWYYRS